MKEPNGFWHVANHNYVVMLDMQRTTANYDRLLRVFPAFCAGLKGLDDELSAEDEPSRYPGI